MTTMIAHRGASAQAPENTLVSFELAIEQGATMLELDVQITADEQLVVLHDSRLERTTDAAGEVSAFTLAELGGVRALGTDPERFAGRFAEERVGIPTLRAVLELVVRHGVDLNIETKQHGDTALRVNDLVAEAVASADWMGRTLVSSFNHAAMAELKSRHAGLRTALAVIERFDDLAGYARDCGADTVHPYHRLIDAELVERLHSAGLTLNAWTVDDAEELDRLVRLGVDGVMTNESALLRGSTR